MPETRPNLCDLPNDQKELVRAYCALWVEMQTKPTARVRLAIELSRTRAAMTDLARLRCSQYERGWGKEHRGG
jgi:hypothetical protein